MFYTILPQLPLIKPTFKRIARFAPAIGLVIGFLQSISWILLSYFNWPNTSVTMISVAISIIATGGLHIDGLIDTADGIWAGSSKRLEAIKDSRVGAMGVQCFAMVLILQIAALIKLDTYAPFVFPIAAFWGRVSQIFAIGNYNYLFKRDRISFHKKYWKGIFSEIKPSLIIIGLFIIIFLFLNEINLSNTLLIISFLSFGIATSILIPYILNKLLGGHNGDSYGASLVLTETFTLLFISFILVPS